MTERDSRLEQFFSAYFNQDWSVGGASAWQHVVAEYVKENSPMLVHGIVSDLRSWLEQGETDRPGLSHYGCAYDPHTDELSEGRWVELLAAALQKQLSSQGHLSTGRSKMSPSDDRAWAAAIQMADRLSQNEIECARSVLEALFAATWPRENSKPPLDSLLRTPAGRCRLLELGLGVISVVLFLAKK